MAVVGGLVGPDWESSDDVGWDIGKSWTTVQLLCALGLLIALTLGYNIEDVRWTGDWCGVKLFARTVIK